MSRSSRFEPGAPIRGGVPVCFPWFGPRAGDAAAPVHGFARTRTWALESVGVTPGGEVDVRLALRSDATTLAIIPQAFSAVFALRLGHALRMALEVTNDGAEAFRFEEALHTYFTVADVRQVSVDGLAGATYLDKTDGGRRKTQSEPVVRISAETDRLYLDTTAVMTLVDPGLARRIVVEKSGSASSVVWNPWIAKSRAMPDFGDDEWPEMICLETVNAVDNAVVLAPGARHELVATVTVAALEG